jgi:hypothetical protein
MYDYFPMAPKRYFEAVGKKRCTVKMADGGFNRIELTPQHQHPEYALIEL